MGASFKRICAASALLAGTAGCGPPALIELEGLELGHAEEVLSDFPLGTYMVAIPLAEEQAENQAVRRHRLQLDFSLYALLTPKEAAQVSDAWARHEGKIRDQVIRVCRNATVDELQEPELTTLKTRLIDALTGPLGNKEVRQLLISDLVTHQL